MYYEVKQKETHKLFGLFNTTHTSVYKFKQYHKAIEFCLHEQIDTIWCVLSEKVKTKRKPFWMFFTFEEFDEQVRKNPMHYINGRTHKGLNTKQYYLYLLNNKMYHKLKKHK